MNQVSRMRARPALLLLVLLAAGCSAPDAEPTPTATPTSSPASTQAGPTPTASPTALVLPFGETRPLATRVGHHPLDDGQAHGVAPQETTLRGLSGWRAFWDNATKPNDDVLQRDDSFPFNQPREEDVVALVVLAAENDCIRPSIAGVSRDAQNVTVVSYEILVPSSSARWTPGNHTPYAAVFFEGPVEDVRFEATTRTTSVCPPGAPIPIPYRILANGTHTTMPGGSAGLTARPYRTAAEWEAAWLDLTRGNETPPAVDFAERMVYLVIDQPFSSSACHALGVEAVVTHANWDDVDVSLREVLLDVAACPDGVRPYLALEVPQSTSMGVSIHR